MAMSSRKARYIEEHFRRHSDEQLAQAMGVGTEIIRETRENRGLERSESDETCIRRNPGAELPTYTGQLPLPDAVAPLAWGDFLVCALVFLVSLTVYVRTLGPTVTGEDGGLLVTAAYTLGIPHPPGYPLWCMLGRLFTLIVPFGSIAWRVNLMSAFFGALTVPVAYLLGAKLTKNRLAGVTAALAYAFSSEFWKQCVMAEVYPLNTFLIALCLLLIIGWYETRKTSLLYWLAVVYGLGLCHHKTPALLGPLFLAAMLFVEPMPWKRWKTYAGPLALCAVIVVVIHVYLPIRSLANPPIDYGNPENWNNFVSVVTMALTGHAFLQNPYTLGGFWSQFVMYLGYLVQQFSPWVVWAPVLGLAALPRYDRRVSFFLVGFFLYLNASVMLVINSGVDFLSEWTTICYLIPAYIVLAMLIGCAVDLVASWTITRGASATIAVMFAAVCVLTPLWANYYENDKSEYYFTYDYGMNVLKTLDENAILIATSDDAAFSTLYLQAVEGMRPDVILGNKTGDREEALYQDMPDEMRNILSQTPRKGRGPIIDAWAVARSGRPVYFTRHWDLVDMPDWKLVNAGLLYRAARPDEQLPPRDFWREYAWHTLDLADTRGDLSAMSILATYYSARGRAYLDNDETQKALDSFETAYRAAPRYTAHVNNLAATCLQYGLFDEAVTYCSRVLKMEPNHRLALLNLGVAYAKHGDFERALEPFRRLVALRPKDSEANWLLLDCLRRLDRTDEVIAHMEEMTVRTPDDARLFRELGLLYLRIRNDPVKARDMFAQSLSLNPNQPELRTILQGLRSPALGAPDGVTEAH